MLSILTMSADWTQMSKKPKMLCYFNASLILKKKNPNPNTNVSIAIALTFGMSGSLPLHRGLGGVA